MMAQAGGGAVFVRGMINFCPILIKSGRSILLIKAKDDGLAPNRLAIPPRLSPFRTSYIISFVELLGILSFFPTKRRLGFLIPLYACSALVEIPYLRAMPPKVSFFRTS